MTAKAIPFLFLASVLVAPGLQAQEPNPAPAGPQSAFHNAANTAARFIQVQALACREAETASAAELDGLDRALQRLIQEQENIVRKLAADSAPVRAATREYADAVARLKPLQNQLDPLIVRKNEIDAAQKPFEDAMAAARQGDAPAGSTTRLAQIEELIKGLDEQHARLKDEYDKIADKDNWLQGRDEQLEALMKENRNSRDPLAKERDGILARVSQQRENPAYAALLAEEEQVDVKIATLKEQIRSLTSARDSAKQTLDDSAVPEAIALIETFHERNGFIHQYLSEARDCIQKRRTQLAGAPATPATPAAPAPQPGLGSTLLNGHWDATCSGDLPPDAARTDGGDMNFYFGGPESGGSVRVSFITSGKVIGIDYGATGRINNDGTIADGRGGASYYNLVWDGRIEADLARSPGINLGVVAIPDKFKGNGNVTITDIYRTGGGTCQGTWTAATP